MNPIWLRAVRASGLVGDYLLRDEFTTVESAPLASPRTCEPGPGTLTLTQVDGNFGISTSGTLDVNPQSSPALGDLGFVSAGVSRTAGLAMLINVTINTKDQWVMGLADDNTGGWNAGLLAYFETVGTGIKARIDGTNTDLANTFSLGFSYDVACILRGTGVFLFVRGGSFSDWTLLWVDSLENTATVYPKFGAFDGGGQIGEVIVSRLSSPWNTDYGIATQRLSGGQSAGQTFTHEDDFFIEFTVTTRPSAGQIEMRFRVQDASNYWQATINSSGILDIDEVVASTPTQRGTASGVTNGTRVSLAAHGAKLIAWRDNVLAIEYDSAELFRNETSGELESLGTGGAVSDIVTWPRVLSGTAKIRLDELFPPTTLENSGAWSWFTAPRGLHYSGVNDRTYYGAVRPTGLVVVRQYDHISDTFSSWLEVHSTGTEDDHDHPSFLVRASDQKILIFYGPHNGDNLYMRISSNAEDATAFGAEVGLASSLGNSRFTYSVPIQLTDEANDPIYLFYRSIDPAGGTNSVQSWWFSKSEDDGATWASGTELYGDPSQITSTYFHAVQNGNGRIDFVVTDGHPAHNKPSIYHFYYEGGNYRKSDGTLIGDATALPLRPADITQVYDGSTTEGWNWDIAINASGNPVIAYSRYPTDTDHRYHYAVWNGTSWDDNEIVAAGNNLTDNEKSYAAGMCLDHDDPTRAYLSRFVSGQFEIYRYVTADGGSTWTPTAITSGSSEKQFRPFVPFGSHATESNIMWLAGRYDDWDDFNTAVEVGDD